MKTVRLALGLVGAAPVIGLVMPAATATAAPAPVPKNPAKTASMAHGQSAQSPASTSAACAGHKSLTVHSNGFQYTVYHTPSTGCVGGVAASLAGASSGRVLRTRAYSYSSYGAKTKYFSAYKGGTIGCDDQGLNCSIAYYQGIHQIRPPKEQICEAIVSGNHNKVYKGPKCVSW